MRGSRIRREPPPVAKKVAERDPDERDELAVVIGVIAFGLAIFVLVLAFGSYSGWSPGEYTLNMEL